MGGKAELWGLIGEGNEPAHVFLMNGGRALDMGGYCSLEEMKQLFADGFCTVSKLTHKKVWAVCEESAHEEYRTIVETRIRQHLADHPELFR